MILFDCVCVCVTASPRPGDKAQPASKHGESGSRGRMKEEGDEGGRAAGHENGGMKTA